MNKDLRLKVNLHYFVNYLQPLKKGSQHLKSSEVEVFCDKVQQAGLLLASYLVRRIFLQFFSMMQPS